MGQVKEDNRAEYGHDDAPEIKSRDARCANEAEQESAEERADYADNDITHDSLAMIVDSFAADEARDETKYEPCDDRHTTLHSLPFAGRSKCATRRELMGVY